MKNKKGHDIDHRVFLKSGEIRYATEPCVTEYNEKGEADGGAEGADQGAGGAVMNTAMKMNSEAETFLFQGKRLLAAICGIMLLFLALAASSAEATDETKLLFLGNKNIAPVVYLDNGIPAGVVVDIVRALAPHLPKPVEIKAMDWQEAQALVARGDADAVIQINATEERKKIYDFSDTLLESQFSIFTSTGRVGISGMSSLRGLRVGVEAGGLPRQLLEKEPLIQLHIIPNFLEGFKLLNNGTVDAVVVDYRVGAYIIAENGLRNIKVTGMPITSSFSAIAVKKGNTTLLNAINSALRIIKDDGAYDTVLKKWKPKEVVFQTREQIRQRRDFVIIVVLLALFLIAAAWTLTLRRELVRRRAAEKRLGENEARFRALFEDSPISLWEEDFSRVKQQIDALKTSGISDFRAYFTEHPEEVVRCAHATKIVAVNRATLKLFKGDSQEQLLEGLDTVFSEESFDIFREELITLASGGTQFESEAIQKNMAGEKFDTIVRLSLAPGYERSWEKVFVSVSDITERKQAEEALHVKAAELEEEVTERQMAQENLQEKALLLEEEIEKRQKAQDELEQLNDELEQRVIQRTAELEARNADLQKMNKVFVGRELRMVELKGRIKELEGRHDGLLMEPPAS
ncbi:MAG: transporter substrate-binding domain-containing protein [Desulfuromonadaceae bacterium]|nr:transporter substrate-binding domain-containing protein [Desulfuromonadaceae bacterium]MDD5106840.1 transporter substrate-binding domain-containing protein [Desulfuromonadaceae bacterium]